MNIYIDSKIQLLLCPFQLVIIQADGLLCTHSTDELLQKINELENEIAEKYILENINNIKEIAESRKAYKKLGADPNRYRPSADSLHRRIVKKLGLYRINNVVEIINYISLKYGFSIGGYDVMMIEGKVELGVGRQNEMFTGIGRGAVNIKNLPVLRDDIGAFGNPTSDSERTRIQFSTTSITLVFYDFGNSDQLLPAIDETKSLLRKYAEISMVNDNIEKF